MVIIDRKREKMIVDHVIDICLELGDTNYVVSSYSDRISFSLIRDHRGLSFAVEREYFEYIDEHAFDILKDSIREFILDRLIGGYN